MIYEIVRLERIQREISTSKTNKININSTLTIQNLEDEIDPKQENVNNDKLDIDIVITFIWTKLWIKTKHDQLEWKIITSSKETTIMMTIKRQSITTKYR